MTRVDSDWMAGSRDFRADFMRCRRRCRGRSASSNRDTGGMTFGHVSSWIVVSREDCMKALALCLLSGSLCVGLSNIAAGQSGGAAGAAAGTKIITLGTAGGPLPRKDRAQAFNLLVVNGTLYLIDAGGGVTGRLAQSGYDFRNVGKIFITHAHS